MILLSFDIEEFDTPLEYNKEISFEEQLKVSVNGTKKILDILNKQNIKVTFYCTANFANNCTDLVKEIISDGHELASHGYYHSSFDIADLKLSKDKLEELFGVSIQGYRMARMMSISDDEVEKAGYDYNSSLNPTYLPGRYNNLKFPRTWFYTGKMFQLPASVSPFFRIPLFWLSFHNFPLSVYKYIANRTYKKDKYLNIYFHPWEFEDLNPKQKYNLPFYVRKNSGQKMVNRLNNFIKWGKQQGYSFARTIDFVNEMKTKK